VQTRTLGTETTGTVEVGAIGLGEMPLSLSDRPDRQQAIRTVHAALDVGVTFIDTADAYCADASDFGHGEELLAEALGRRSRDVLVATKGGHTRDAAGGWHVDGSPDYLRRACDASLKRRHRPGRADRPAGGLRRGGRGARGEPAAGLPRLDAGQVADRRPDPRLHPAGDDHRLGGRRRPDAHRRGAGPAGMTACRGGPTGRGTGR
jgi:hypothetical protein